MRILYISVFAVFIMQFCCSIKNETLTLKGSWKVVDYQLLLHHRILDDSDLIKKQILDDSICKISQILITDSSISILPKSACNFIDCNLKNNYVKNRYSIVKNDSVYFKYPGAEIIEYNFVSREFANIIGIRGDFVDYYDTSCKLDWDNFSLKIFIINKNQIVLFGGIDLTFLKRI